MVANDNDKKRNEMKLPIYMKAGKDNKTIIVKWWGVLWLKFRYVFLSNVSGRLQLFKYVHAMLAGMCFEYVYRVDSDVWYIPLCIGVMITVTLIIDSLSNDR